VTAQTEPKFFNVSPLLNAPSTILAASRDELRTMEEIAQRLESEIRKIALDCHQLSTDRAKVNLCIDFSVIHSALHVQRDAKDDTFWAAMALDIEAFDLILLPGALFELIGYVNRLDPRIFNEQVAHAFLHAFERNFAKPDAISEAYGNMFDQVVRITGGSDNYLLRLLRERLKPGPSSKLLRADDELMYEYMYHLSYGSRSDKVTNNRVDAYNLALVSALNAQTSVGRERYVMVSNAKSMAKLERFVQRSSSPEELSHGGRHELPLIWRPRYASIHQLFYMAGHGSSGAGMWAWRIVERLVAYRASISERMSEPSRERTSSSQPEWTITSDDLFIRLISSIERLQELVNSARMRHVEMPKSLTDDPKQTRKLIKAELGKFLKLAPYAVATKELSPAKPVELRLERASAPNDQGELHKYMICDATEDKWLAGLYSGKEFSGVWFKTYASLEQFVAVANFVRHHVFALVHITELPLHGGKEQAGVFVGTESEIKEIDIKLFDWPLRTYQICELAMRRPDEIRFIRINTHWFDISFEVHSQTDSRYCAMASHFGIFAEFEAFVRELGDPAYRGANFRPILRRAFFQRNDAKFGLRR